MRTLIAAAVAAFAFAVPGTARADVLVSAPPRVIDCGHDIEVGVWYQSYSGGPRWAVIRIESLGERLLARKRVRATTTWRYWYFTPDCARSYRVVYRTPGGTSRFKVRVRD